MNKKGFLAMAMVDFWSLVLIIVILLGFTYLFFVTELFTGKSTRLLDAEANIEASSLLLGLLRHDAEDGCMIEYILANKDNLDNINEKVSSIMDKACSLEDSCSWKLVLLMRGEEYSMGDTRLTRADSYGKAEFLLPAKDEKIIVRLWIYENPEHRIIYRGVE